MSYLQTFQVYPNVPEKLEFIEDLLRNLWWCWNLDAIELFRRVSPKLWEQSGRNPIVFSTLIPQERLDQLARDDSILAHQERVKERFENQVAEIKDFSQTPYGETGCIAYFSMEFGIHESLPIYAGGLGILAGDHLKAASDLGLPLVGVGLLYRGGYFHQYLNQDGWQQEEYPETDLFHLPVKRAKDKSGNKFRISIPGPDGDIQAAVWEVNVGRIPLYLLDTNLSENSPKVREITHRLYAGEQDIRLAQEVLLGIGGMRALEAMGIRPVVCHMNEGHCAFVGLERMAQLKAELDVDLNTAAEIVSRTTVFTTHTPVAAGHDEFPVDMVKPYLTSYKDKLEMPVEKILALGQPDNAKPDGPFCMFVLGLRSSQYCNGVSQLHGRVARGMWKHVWPRLPENEVPISHVTNGVHIPSWISIENNLLFERYLGPEWHLKTQSPSVVQRIDDIYDEELWRAHEMSRSRLIRHCRRKMVKQYSRRNAPSSVLKEAESVLDPDALTIAFARRFATYKRATLLLQDPNRLEAILNNPERPVQFIFSGKAHPKDHGGKELIQRLIQFARRPGVRHRMIFLEDYDPSVARHLVQGADIWLNNPRRPYEACGTSGMKAAVNGVLNVSILDGWWCEGYEPNLGWRIGKGEEYRDEAFQDAVESQALYNVLEDEVIPCFYERENGNAPVRWLKMMKESMKMTMSGFCSLRMVKEYEDRFYLPSAARYEVLLADDAAHAKALYAQHQRLLALWEEIRIQEPVMETDGPFRVGARFNVSSRVHLGKLTPEEVEVQLYYGNLKTVELLDDGRHIVMEVTQDLTQGDYQYSCQVPCDLSGRFGFTVRVRPKGDTVLRNSPGLITWA